MKDRELYKEHKHLVLLLTKSKKINKIFNKIK